MKIIRLLLLYLAFASFSPANGSEVQNGLIDQCLQAPVKEVTLGSEREGVSTSFYISEQCIHDESVHEVVGFPKIQGNLSAVFCPKINGQCGKREWISLSFSYYFHPEMLRQNPVEDEYIENVNGFSVFEHRDGKAKLLPNNDEIYYLTCRHDGGSQYYACTMNGGVYKDRVRYRVHYPGSFERYDFHRINDEINDFIRVSVRYERQK